MSHIRRLNKIRGRNAVSKKREKENTNADDVIPLCTFIYVLREMELFRGFEKYWRKMFVRHAMQRKRQVSTKSLFCRLLKGAIDVVLWRKRREC